MSNKNKNNKPQCLFYTTYYQSYIDNLYIKNSALEEYSYEEQKKYIHEQRFGDSDFYSRGLIKTGWIAEDFISNSLQLQKSWARDNNFNYKNEDEIIIEQIKRLKPEVVYLHNMGIGTTEFLETIRPYTKLIVGQIACPVVKQTDFKKFDIIISSFPHFVNRFRNSDITAYYQPLAFDPKILYNIKKNKRHYPITFVGSISSNHEKGQQLLEALAENVPIDFWGYGIDQLSKNSNIRKRHHGEAWGNEMFSIFTQSKITVNRHIDVAENYANNMRLFEATGCGALLITDYKDNLDDLFRIGKEVVAYRNIEECIELIKYYINHPDEATKIAKAGQKRTLENHTYDIRMKQTAKILEKHLQKERKFKDDNQNINYPFKSKNNTNLKASVEKKQYFDIEKDVYKDLVERPDKLWKNINDGIQYFNKTTIPDD